MPFPTIVNQILSSQAVQSLCQTSLRWHGHLVVLLQNRTLAGVAFLISTAVGCILGAKIAPIMTLPLTNFINRVCDRYPYASRLLVSGTVFFVFGSIVFTTNLLFSKLFKLPLSVKFSLIVTLIPPSLAGLATAVSG